MADPPNPIVITARVLIDPGAEPPERTRGYVLQALKSSCRNIRDGAVVIGLYDEDDNLIGMDMTGVPREALQDMIDDIFGLYEEGGGPHVTPISKNGA